MKIFLRAEWRCLAVLSYRAEESYLTQYLPAGIELDTWEGSPILSIVGFTFQKANILGVPALGHRFFPELNLRFYVRRKVGDEIRKGVVFIKEICPKRLVSLTASLLYNEDFTTCPMRSFCIPDQINPQEVRYEWKFKNKWNSIALYSSEEFEYPQNDFDRFIVDRYWGYNKSRGGETIEFEVAHPEWEVRNVSNFSIQFDFEALYGELSKFLVPEPLSVTLINGSEVALSKRSFI